MVEKAERDKTEQDVLNRIRWYENKIKKTRAIFISMSILITSFLVFLFAAQPFNEGSKFIPLDKIAFIIFSYILLILTMYIMLKAMYKEKINNLQYELKSTSIMDDEKSLHQKALKMSYNYLDRYYSQTQDQANKGFIATICVALFGAFIIIGGIISMFFGITEPAYITVATGAITEFISSIFFYLYNKTVASMGKYHDKLVLSQNISYAFELTETVSEEKKDSIKEEIIKELVKDINLNLHDNSTH